MLKDCSIMKRNSSLLLILCLLLVACASESKEHDFVIGTTAAIDGLHAPWDNLNDNTKFRCFVDDTHFRFLFEIVDSTLMVNDFLTKETDIDFEDRGEIFFSPTKDMSLYWCAEMDPKGRIMDYSCRYYRNMDYTWKFETLEVVAAITSGGYMLSGKLALDELKEMGINEADDFYMGVFRADYRQDGSVKWFSHVMADDETPDFHKPEMLFKVRMSQ